MTHWLTTWGILLALGISTVYLRVNMRRITKAQTKSLANVMSTAFKAIANLPGKEDRNVGNPTGNSHGTRSTTSR